MYSTVTVGRTVAQCSFSKCNQVKFKLFKVKPIDLS